MSASFVAVALALPSVAHAARVPSLEGTCDLTGLGIDAPTGVVSDPVLGIGVLDGTDRRIRFMDDHCAPTGLSIQLGAYSQDPQGVGWSSTMGELAVVDATADELFFVSPGGARLGSCDLATIGSASSSGVAWDPTTSRWVVMDAGGSTAWWIDPAGRSGSTCTVTSSVVIPDGPRADDLAVDATGRLVVSDTYHRRVDTYDATGANVDSFSLTPSGDDAQGVVLDATGDRPVVVDGSKNRLARYDNRGTTTEICSVSAFVSQPRGLAVDPARGELLVLDNGTRSVARMDTSCVLAGTIPLNPAGLTNMRDVGFDPVARDLVVDDNGVDLAFVDPANGAVRSTCDVSGLGVGLAGIDVLAGLDRIALTFDVDGTWMLLDPACEPVHQRPLKPLTNGTAADIAWHPASGTLLLASSQYVVAATLEGVEARRFLLTSQLAGLVADPGDSAVVWALDVSGRLFRVELPGLVDWPGSVSGRFSNGVATIQLWERGGGALSGTAFVNGDTIPLFGQLDGAGGDLFVGGITPTGAAQVVPVTISADGATLTAPPPFGILTRQ
ncbi:MAG: hypothetical protein H6738_07625 [Alphaproteobacteria bacterium]|nr:hypothetical protein [Alphaproteobacteria bacterium]MCB9696634.1 hypothetical protein [Alphaproteobacteria bacterium]